MFFGRRAASAYSSDFSRAGLDQLVNSALTLAKITSEDPFGAGFRKASQLGSISGDLDLYYDRCLFAGRCGSHRLCTRRAGEGGAGHLIRASRTPRGGSFDAATGPQGTGEFARVCGGISAVLLFGRGGADRADRSGRDAAGLLGTP